MNDKQQLAAMGVKCRLTEEQAKAMAERMPQTGVMRVLDDEPLCMAKRIEELEAQVRVMAGLLREARPYVKDCADWGRPHDLDLRDAIDEVLNGVLVPIPATQDGWQLVPVKPTIAMLDEFDAIVDYGAEDSLDAWGRMLAAAPSPDRTK